MVVEVVLPGVLAADAGGASRVLVEVTEGADVGAVLDAVAQQHPRLGRRIRDEAGAVRKYVNLFLDGEDIRHLAGLRTPVPSDSAVAKATLIVLPSVAGG